MKSTWQKRFSLDIDWFFGRLFWRAMHPTARAGCIFLLFRQWDAENGMLPRDREQLAALAGLSPRDWKKHHAAILDFFEPTADGNLVNRDVYEEWVAKKKRCESRRVG